MDDYGNELSATTKPADTDAPAATRTRPFWALYFESLTQDQRNALLAWLVLDCIEHLSGKETPACLSIIVNTDLNRWRMGHETAISDHVAAEGDTLMDAYNQVKAQL
jgi:hypothetical protein